MVAADHLQEARCASRASQCAPGNRYADNAAAAALGQRFFFEKAYSGALGTSGVNGGLGNLGQLGRVSCASCHMSQSWFIDTRSNPNNVSSGANGFQSRNTPSLVNNMFYTWFNHNGGRSFRTAGLRNIAQTAPFMHTGAFATLADVVEFYDRGGDSSSFVGTKDSLMVPLGLASPEKSDLVAFLETLTGDTIPDRLVHDTSAP